MEIEEMHEELPWWAVGACDACGTPADTLFDDGVAKTCHECTPSPPEGPRGIVSIACPPKADAGPHGPDEFAEAPF